MAAKLVISGYMANPAGTDSPYEYLQVIATEAIDFAATPYTVVWSNNGTALANGWVSGTALTYGFSINSGTIAKGQVAYIGGSGKLINGAATTDISAANWLKTINTSTTAGDGFGALNTGGVLGNGGANADGIAIFDVPVASITSTTVPVDAVFFGTGVGTANPATGGYVLPTNDIYNNAQGTFGDGTNTTLFPDPASGAFTKLTGTYNAVTGTWTTPRTAATVTNPTALTDIAAAVTIASTTPLPDLTIASSAPATATVNTPFNYTLTLTNSGTAAATGVSAKFTLPAGVTYNSASGTGFTATQAAGVVTFTGGAIAAGGNVPLTINVTPTAAGTVSSTIGAAVADPGSAIAESNETNNSSTTAVTTTVTATANTPPTIAPSAASTFLTVPTLSGVINDPTDPAKNFGVNFTLADAETAVGNLTLTATSSNTAVVPNANLTISGTGASRNLKINPVGVGFADLTVTVSDGTSTTSTVLKYAASAASGNPTTSRFLTGTSDASTAIAIDSNYMVVADDEDQTIRLYDRANSGLPVKTFNFTNSLGLTDISGGIPREIDIEASTRAGNKIYWLASHSNASGGNLRPNRYRLFATDISGSGATTNLTFAGKYDNLRNDLIAWGNTNGFNFTASAAAGKIPEATTLDGFNIEGLTLAPNGTTAYVAFRAPQVPTSDRTKALIAPITNFTELVTATATSAMIGAPIQLDLGGRGIRSIDRNANNEYLIVAGPADSATGTAPKDFRLYTWTGNPADAPQVRSANLTALNAGGSFESIVEVPSNLTNSSQIQLLVDNGDNIWYGNNVISKDLPQDNFQKFRSDIVTLGSSPVRIRNIQGASHTSPLATQTVSNVPGVVTAVISSGGGRGFYIQDPTPDTGPNPNSTSEAIFVFLGSSTIPNPTVGQSVQVTGRVDEFRPANNATNLTLTQINATVAGSAVGAIASLGTITPTVIGTGGRIQPTTSIQNDFSATAGNVETGGDFDPTAEGIDFYESLESMLVQVNNPVVVGPTNNFGEFYVLPDNGANATGRTSRGGIAVSANDFNPERIQIDDTLLNPPSNGSLSPAVNVGDKLTTFTGVVGYSFSNYELLNTAQIPQASVTSGGLTKEVTNLTGSASQLTVATFNVENLDPSDTAKFPAIANRIVTNLKSPDIINVEEIQDNNGATNDGVVAADTTYNTLIAAIKTAGGPTYEFRQINPVNNQDGGEPGGNIRVGFLFNPSRVTFVDRPGGTSTTATTVNNVSGSPVLSASPGRIDPTNAAFDTSRKPLVGEFKFNGQSVFVIANHFNSKGGDQPLFGPSQPPTLTSETQRLQQAQIVNNFVDSILAVDANANVIVAGDLNDFQFSEPLNVVRGIPKGTGTAVLQNLIETLPENERYTYNFQGNAQVLDHILASNNLAKNLAGFDVVHINSEFAAQDSDHDPSVARFNIALPKPTVTITATDAAAAESGANPGIFRIARSGSTTLPLTVNYTTASGTGFASSNDFTPNLTGSIIIPAGQSFADVTITPIDDRIVEGSEAVKLTLVGNAAYNLGAAGTQTATVAIADNDVSAPGTFNFSNATYSVNENGATQTITVNRTGVTNVSASVS
ncbi:CARDB domain-containing protein [Microcoleus sp. CAWBG58]|uniref:endonuclease/exonuclease/phosphatase family protein n=1 Tax=Microcoleus sp. CAWBG58 TaxID=2841651 RepID=UPI0025F65422|nr:CARDB domain-containing protein [Microcoleus sp. CAWBG58]